jgi:hypothetical protein
VLLNTAFTASAHYKELIAILKRVKEVATQPDELLDEDDDEEDDKEDSALSDEEALDKDFNPPTCSYISLLSNQLPNTL